MAFPHLMYLIVNGVLRLLGKFMIYFMICSYSKSEATKKEFVKHWSESIIMSSDEKNVDWDEVVKKEARGTKMLV